jgi:hypothetical protein
MTKLLVGIAEVLDKQIQEAKNNALGAWETGHVASAKGFEAEADTLTQLRAAMTEVEAHEFLLNHGSRFHFEVSPDALAHIKEGK